MSTKAKTTKSRTSNNKKANKLKWWYILPVIVIVAIAGYAIVRFSEAGSAYTRIRPSSRVTATTPSFIGCKNLSQKSIYGNLTSIDIVAEKPYQSKATSITVKAIRNGSVVSTKTNSGWIGNTWNGVQIYTSEIFNDRLEIYYTENGKTYNYIKNLNPYKLKNCQPGTLLNQMI